MIKHIHIIAKILEVINFFFFTVLTYFVYLYIFYLKL